MPEMVNFASFDNPEACGQTLSQNILISIGQILVENAKIMKFKSDILSDFQTLWWKFKLFENLKI